MLTIKQFTFNPVQENTYVIYNEKGECCIIDPGCYFSNERNELKNFISEHRLRPKYLLNTHCHLDHVFGNKFIHDEYGLTLHFHPEEKPVFDNGPASGLMWGLPFDNYKGELIYIDEGDTMINWEMIFLKFCLPRAFPRKYLFLLPGTAFYDQRDVLFQDEHRKN